MLNGLAAHLGIESFKQLLGRFVLLTDAECDGQFTVHHFVGHAVRDGVKTYLVSFAHAFVHYKTVCAKLGVNLPKAQSSGQLVFVDCLTHLLDGAHCDGGSGTGDSSSQSTPLHFSLDRSKPNCLANLYKLLESLISEDFKSGQPVALVIDDVSVCLSLGVKREEVVQFLHYCRVLLDCGLAASKGCLVTMSHDDDDVGIRNEQDGCRLLRLTLQHSCSLHLHVSGLATGYSRDVHGEITVEWRQQPTDRPPPGARLPEDRDAIPLRLVHRSPTTSAQFKLTDRNVNIFAKGLSSVTL